MPTIEVSIQVTGDASPAWRRWRLHETGDIREGATLEDIATFVAACAAPVTPAEFQTLIGGES